MIALLATRHHVDIFLYDGGLAPDPEAVIADIRAGGWRKLKRDRAAS